MQGLQKLVRIRAGLRTVVTKSVNDAKDILDTYEAGNGPEMEAICTVLQKKLEKLTIIDDQILDLKTADEDVTEEALVAEIQGAADVALKIKTIFREAELKRVKVDEFDRASSGSAERVKLPKIDLEKFSGDPKKWQQWWDCFESVIHTNDLSNVDKFNYLRSLLTGDALNAISGMSSTNENYDSAIQILTERFGKKVVVISSHMDALMKLPVLADNDNTQKFRRVYDKIESHIRSLQGLGVESKNYGCASNT